MKLNRYTYLLAAVLVAVFAADAAAQSLTVTFRDAAGDRITSDGGAYIDLGDPGGGTPAVQIGSGDNIAMDLRGSMRTLCLNLDEPLGAVSALAPKNGCYPVLMRTLLTETGGVTALPPGGTGTFSLVIYWTGPGEDGKSRDYNLEFKRVDGNGVIATASLDGNSWQIDPITDIAKVSAYVKGKGAGWNVVGLYDMPTNLLAERQVPDLRQKGKKK